MATLTPTRAAALAVALLAASAAQAHQPSDAYLWLDGSGERTRLRWEIALRDLDTVLPALDADGDRRLTWAEVRAARPAIEAVALAALQVPGCRFTVDGHALVRRSDGAYAVLLASAPCRVAAATPVHYALFHDTDPTHRGLLVRGPAQAPAGRVQALVPAPLPAGARR